MGDLSSGLPAAPKFSIPAMSDRMIIMRQFAQLAATEAPTNVKITDLPRHRPVSDAQMKTLKASPTQQPAPAASQPDVPVRYSYSEQTEVRADGTRVVTIVYILPPATPGMQPVAPQDLYPALRQFASPCAPQARMSSQASQTRVSLLAQSSYVSPQAIRSSAEILAHPASQLSRPPALNYSPAALYRMRPSPPARFLDPVITTDPEMLPDCVSKEIFMQTIPQGRAPTRGHGRPRAAALAPWASWKTRVIARLREGESEAN